VTTSWGQPPAPQPTRPWWKKKRFTVPLGFVAFLVIVGLFAPDPEPAAVVADLPATTVTETRSDEEVEASETLAALEEQLQAKQDELASLEAEEPTEPEVTKPVTYKKITHRQWAKINRNPDAHIGEAITIYGEITQSDAATGTQAALADVDGVFRPLEYGYADYDDNALLSADGDELADAVEKDTFRAKVEIMGSYTYDTQIGGSTTVPQLKVRSLKVTGSSD
jgi:hypothetical protein